MLPVAIYRLPGKSAFWLLPVNEAGPGRPGELPVNPVNRPVNRPEIFCFTPGKPGWLGGAEDSARRAKHTLSFLFARLRQAEEYLIGDG